MGKKSGRRFKSTSSAKREQNRHIRSILSKAFKDSGLNQNQLLDALNRETGYEIAYNTLSTAITPPSTDGDDLDTTINLYTVIALCRYYHLDTAYVLSPPGTAEPAASPSAELINTSKFHALDDLKYCGTYHGYFYSPNQRSTDIIHFKLEIPAPSESHTSRFTYYGTHMSTERESQSDIRIFFGTPILSTVSSNIYIILTNDFGDFYFMYYDRHVFRKSKLYFRRGIIATPSTIGGYEPEFQIFALFSQELSQDKEILLKGLLNGIGSKFFVKTDELKQLRSEYKIVDDFCQRYNHILEHDIMNVTFINEAMFLNDPSDTDRADDVEALLLMKTQSIIPSRIVFSENDQISKFCKKYILREDYTPSRADNKHDGED